MKQTKRILSVVLCLLMLVAVVPVMNVGMTASAATFEDINDSSVFLKQEGSSTCTLVAAAMMMRRYAMLRGDTDWSSITEASLKPTAWVSGQGLRLSFSYKDISVNYGTLSANNSNTSTLINLLAAHPEGIALYRHVSNDYQHAVLLTDYADGTFYCAEPLSTRDYGRIPISKAYCVTITGATQYWYVTSAPVSFTPTYANLGDDFYGVILNTEYWKPISQLDGTDHIYLDTEWNTSKQVWHFQRQEDGAYVISSCNNGKALEMYSGNASICTPVSACSEFWGGYYQQWYLIPQGNGYVFLSKHFPEKNLVMDLHGANSENGSVIQVNERNNSIAQIWSIYTGDDVQLKSQTLSVQAGNSATNTIFTWTNAYGANEYRLKIWKNKVFEGDAYHIEWNAKSGVGINLPAGSYQAYVDTLNYYNCLQSNIVTFTVAAHNHNYSSTITKAATCTTSGVRTYTCSCGASYTETIAALGHSYGAWTKLNDTQHQRVCSRNSSHVEKANHTWNSGAVTKAATCIATGVKTYTCTVCNATKTEAIAINSSNHVNKTNVAATASTCTVKGYTAGVYCNDCKKYISGHAEQPLAAHKTTTQNAKAATCTAEGYTGDQVCTVCKQTISKGTVIAKKAHTLTTINQKNAGCTTAGYTGDQYCTTCKQTITKGSTVAALGHADADSNGNCTRCGQHIKDVTPSQPSNPQPNPNACKYCGQVHTGPFGWLIKFFHSILAIFKR